MTITGDVFLFFLGLLALVLMGLGRRNILVTLSSSMIWLSLFIWLFFSSTPPLDMSQNWAQILAFVFLMLTFVPWLMRMNVEIKQEAGGKKWTEWGRPPKEPVKSRSQSVKERQKERLKIIRERRRF